ncbi:putative DNA binding domain-containing protein [Corynebacterium sp. CCM 9185]|uniref:DNA binding domain-containing protein n=1 Tax=Corynebacterium marambiense TaxID=2765364 RepID=A0ABS0VY63_9CORY|nr:RNA-binding domain-containing protein [Corynebacterium marambiense]MBI9001723.1 putative DNA binding domain-containing protein [Corynebacterium marambiense]MCK7662187.1 putative DNA binding domain-containing protein [Corynebacterium marambiense]MCX7541457.1 putative DNA binding domain-containing protein [Corynebacterium marambiense]
MERILDEMRARRGDTTSVEVKRAAGGLPKLAETLCAFANMPDGGTIVLGVDENGGRFDVVGVSDIAEMEAGVVSTARQTVEPAPYLDFQDVSISGKKILIVHVSPLRITDKPAYVKDRAYLRQADGDYRMQPHEIRMIEVAKLHADERMDYDIQPVVGRSLDDLVPELVSGYVAATRSKDRRLYDATDQQILEWTNVLTASGEPTLAGFYALGAYPQGRYPTLTVTAAVQLSGGEGKARTRNLHDFNGPLPVLLEEIMEWVLRNIDVIRRYRNDGHMEEVPELPLNAVRELVANALVHRDLGPHTMGVGKQIQIRLTDKNLFIQSPGGLRGVSLAQLESMEHAQAAVNQRLYQIAKRLKTENDGASIIEGEGGGIREVIRSVAARELPPPQLSDTGVQFTARLWRPGRQDNSLPAAPVPSPSIASGRKCAEDSVSVRNPQSQGTQRPGRSLPRSSVPTKNEEAVVSELVRSGTAVTIRELAERTNLSVGQVRYALTQPMRDGFVLMEGHQGVRSTRYRIVDES